VSGIEEPHPLSARLQITSQITGGCLARHSALVDQRSACFEHAALRAKNRRVQIEREITTVPACWHLLSFL
jgi:hypothetical protein